MIKVGMMIGGRYEIMEKIGTGGMSDVYKARCHKLNRLVALKVLKQEFSENASFVANFRTEAQAAARLEHPNIVNVYDVGEENGIYYIVMELVEGITLKKYIEKKARLSYKEAVSIAIQVALGLEAAHNNGIVHRDIKPQNIIISKEGKVKVTDFGIAKAATSNTITSNVMGSVHYTAPEQARGGYSDAKSDIYSLGITLFEMLTGRVPFNGESTVAIAIKQIQEPMPSPKEYIQEIPVSVEQIVLKCCQKSPDRRYQSAEELIDDLKQSLLTPDEDFVVANRYDNLARTQIASEENLAQVRSQTGKMGYHTDEIMGLRLKEGNISASYADDDKHDGKAERITAVVTVVVGVVICAVILYFVIRITGLFNGKDVEPSDSSSISSESYEESSSSSAGLEGEPIADEVSMIAVTNMSVDEADQALRKMGLIVEHTYQQNASYATNAVISASAAPGDKLSMGDTVTLIVSAGDDSKLVSNVVGKTYEEAKVKLSEQGFAATSVETYSDDVAKGLVISQSPVAGDQAPSGSIVTLKISLGPEETKSRVPSLLGEREDDAVVKLVEAGLAVGTVTQQYSDEFENGTVCSQSRPYGSFETPGTAIDLCISLGPQMATYSYSGSIEAPTLAETNGEYVDGSSVGITIVTASGKVLLDTSSSKFPIPVQFVGIQSQTGTLTLSYKVAVDPVIDEDGNEIIADPVIKSFTRTLEFTPEEE